MSPALLCAALLLLLLPGAPAENSNVTPISIRVSNSVTNAPNKTYSTHVVFRGILLGGMRRLQRENHCFKFTYTEHADYGPFLESVNGLHGCPKEQTFWELRVMSANGIVITPDVGIGCYIPCANDTIILNYKKFVSGDL
uniref:Transcobalamin-like C-terminal domain-containing protein n=1 Tax=Labrus bergylta TaxID=56723 RepID=A0A3Q3E903_9LABR